MILRKTINSKKYQKNHWKKLLKTLKARNKWPRNPGKALKMKIITPTIVITKYNKNKNLKLRKIQLSLYL